MATDNIYKIYKYIQIKLICLKNLIIDIEVGEPLLRLEDELPYPDHYPILIHINTQIKTFTVGGERGFYGFIKPELEGNKYRGNYYVIIKENVMYQFTAIGIKKGYNERSENRFTDSFRFN